VACGHINLVPLAWLVGKITNAPVILFIHGIDAWTPTRKTPRCSRDMGWPGGPR
jgi:hypothetical protein